MSENGAVWCCIPGILKSVRLTFPKSDRPTYAILPSGARPRLQVVDQSVDLDDLFRRDRRFGARAEGAIGPGQEFPKTLIGTGAAAELADQAPHGPSSHVACFAEAVQERSE